MAGFRTSRILGVKRDTRRVIRLEEGSDGVVIDAHDEVEFRESDSVSELIVAEPQPSPEG